MNCYNGERYLAEAIRSVLDQTFGDFELVFWDNQSSDESATIVHEFRDSRIRYLRSKIHTSLAEARRLALPWLNGKWIGILDVDDLWRANKLEKQLAALQSMPDAGFAYCGTNILNQQGSDEHVDVFNRDPANLPDGNIYPDLLRGNFIAVASLLINREKLTAIGGFCGRYPIMEDYYVSLNLARRYPVAVVREKLCDYRVHGLNASLSGPVDHFEDLDIVRQHFPDPAAVRAAGRIVLRHFKKSLLRRKSPQLGALLRTITSGTHQPR